MASASSIAKTKEQAYQELRVASEEIAQALGVSIPNLQVNHRYPLEYRQAQELTAIAAFLKEVAVSLAKSKTVTNKTKPAPSKVKQGT